MAAANAVRNMYTRMGFSQAAATEICNEQGYDSLDELKLLSDSDVVELCKVVRRPGGQIPDPVAGPPNMMANPGIPISLRAEKNMKLLRDVLTPKQGVGKLFEFVLLRYRTNTAAYFRKAR